MWHHLFQGITFSDIGDVAVIIMLEDLLALTTSLFELNQSAASLRLSCKLCCNSSIFWPCAINYTTVICTCKNCARFYIRRQVISEQKIEQAAKDSSLRHAHRKTVWFGQLSITWNNLRTVSEIVSGCAFGICVHSITKHVLSLRYINPYSEN